MTIAEVTKRFVAAVATADFTLGDLEREFRFVVVNSALERCKGNQCRAARALGIHRNTLSRILDEMARAGRSPKIVKRQQRRRPAPTVLYDPEVLSRITKMGEA